MKQALLNFRQELIKKAAENEERVQQKCAQYIMAASGLEILRRKLSPKAKR